MAIAGHIKVTPEELSTQAEQVRSAATEMKNCFDCLKTLVSETSYYWKGEAAEAHRESYNKNQTSIEEIIARYVWKSWRVFPRKPKPLQSIWPTNFLPVYYKEEP